MANRFSIDTDQIRHEADNIQSLSSKASTASSLIGQATGNLRRSSVYRYVGRGARFVNSNARYLGQNVSDSGRILRSCADKYSRAEDQVKGRAIRSNSVIAIGRVVPFPGSYNLIGPGNQGGYDWLRKWLSQNMNSIFGGDSGISGDPNLKNLVLNGTANAGTIPADFALSALSVLNGWSLHDWANNNGFTLKDESGQASYKVKDWKARRSDDDYFFKNGNRRKNPEGKDFYKETGHTWQFDKKKDGLGFSKSYSEDEPKPSDYKTKEAYESAKEEYDRHKNAASPYGLGKELTEPKRSDFQSDKAYKEAKEAYEKQKKKSDRLNNIDVTLYDKSISKEGTLFLPVGYEAHHETPEGSALNGLATGSASMDVSKWEAHAGAKVTTSCASLTAGASYTLFNAQAQGQLGNDMFNVHGNAGVDVGKASAEANLGIGYRDENGKFDPHLNAGVSAEAVAAEVHGTAGGTVAGTKVEVTGKAGFGIGVHGNVGYNDGKLTVDVGAYVGPGGSVSFTVDASGTINAVKDHAESMLNNVNSTISNVNSTITNGWNSLKSKFGR
ncbi:MAG: hypothetical protein SOH60_03805 [Lachnospiraceae bacterium]|jgi:hypothetical protein